MMLGLYRLATIVLGPAIALYLERRRAQGKEDPTRFGERLGRADLPRPPGPLLWAHAASVGEALSLLSLIEALLRRDPALHILVTTGTVTSAALMAERLPARALHQYVPVDRPPYVRAFLNHWRPCAALWAESEFWPNLLLETAARRIPVVLINGRVSDNSYRRWKRFPATIGRLLGAFALTLGQTEEDARRLADLGAADAACLGNLKFSAPPLPCDPAALTALTERLGPRPVWLAASTHAGEESLVGRLHAALRDAHPGLLTVIVPRHPRRGLDIAAELRAQGLRVALRSARDDISSDIDVYIADTMGELGLFYRLCPVVFMGKSLLARGGQNPLEPAALGCAVLFGPFMDNFTELARRMTDVGAAQAVADEAALGAAVSALLADPQTARQAGRAGQAFAEAEAGVAERLVDRLAPRIDAACGDAP